MVRHLEVDLAEPGTLADLMDVLEIGPEAGALLLVVNGITAESSRQLEPGDEVHLVPALSGG